MTYGSEIWSLTEPQENKVMTTQRKMERIMLGITLRDKVRNEEIRKKTGIKDIIQKTRKENTDGQCHRSS